MSKIKITAKQDGIHAHNFRVMGNPSFGLTIYTLLNFLIWMRAGDWEDGEGNTSVTADQRRHLRNAFDEAAEALAAGEIPESNFKEIMKDAKKHFAW